MAITPMAAIRSCTRDYHCAEKLVLAETIQTANRDPLPAQFSVHYVMVVIHSYAPQSALSIVMAAASEPDAIHVNQINEGLDAFYHLFKSALCSTGHFWVS